MLIHQGLTGTDIILCTPHHQREMMAYIYPLLLLSVTSHIVLPTHLNLLPLGPEARSMQRIRNALLRHAPGCTWRGRHLWQLYPCHYDLLVIQCTVPGHSIPSASLIPARHTTNELPQICAPRKRTAWLAQIKYV